MKEETYFCSPSQTGKYKVQDVKNIFLQNRTPNSALYSRGLQIINVSFTAVAGYMMFYSPLETLNSILIGGINTPLGIASVQIEFCACLRSCWTVVTFYELMNK